MASVSIDGLDVTQHVAAMYDALISSMDWGSGFLDDEAIEALLIVGHLAGFEMGEPTRDTARTAEVDDDPRPYVDYSCWTSEQRDALVAWERRKLDRWKAQMRAKIEARIAEMKGAV